MADQLRQGTRDPTSWLLTAQVTRMITHQLRQPIYAAWRRAYMICDYQGGATTTLGVVGRHMTPFNALLRQSSPWYVLRRLIPRRDDMRSLDTTFIIIILGVGVRVIKEGGWAHWSLASLTFHHLNPVALDLYNGCPAIPRSPHASHGLAVTVSWATEGSQTAAWIYAYYSSPVGAVPWQQDTIWDVQLHKQWNY